MSNIKTVAPVIYKRILKANNPFEAIDEIEDIEVAKEVLKMIANNIHMTFHDAMINHLLSQRGANYWRNILNDIHSKKMYDITLSAEDYVTIKKELTESEYELIKDISMELEDAGNGWQCSFYIKESK